MVNYGQLWSTMVNNGQQWSTMVNNGQQWSARVNMVNIVNSMSQWNMDAVQLACILRQSWCVGEEKGKEDMKWRQVLTDEGERWMS